MHVNILLVITTANKQKEKSTANACKLLTNTKVNTLRLTDVQQLAAGFIS